MLSFDFHRLARGLLPLMGMLVSATAILLVSGCVLPPPLDVGGIDAGGSPPIVTDSVSPVDFQFPGPIVIEREDGRSFTFTLADNDVEDVLFVRMFRDYQLSPSLHSECTAVPTGTVDRQASCTASRLCDGVGPTDTALHPLEVVVSDQAFLLLSDPEAVGQAPFRAVPAGANTSSRAWSMSCTEPPVPE